MLNFGRVFFFWVGAVSPCPVTVTTRHQEYLFCEYPDPYKPSFATVTGRGDKPIYIIYISMFFYNLTSLTMIYSGDIHVFHHRSSINLAFFLTIVIISSSSIMVISHPFSIISAISATIIQHHLKTQVIATSLPVSISIFTIKKTTSPALRKVKLKDLNVPIRYIYRLMFIEHPIFTVYIFYLLYSIYIYAYIALIIFTYIHLLIKLFKLPSFQKFSSSHNLVRPIWIVFANFPWVILEAYADLPMPDGSGSMSLKGWEAGRYVYNFLGNDHISPSKCRHF